VGRRTVCSALHPVALSKEKRFDKYHAVLSLANWSYYKAARILLMMLLKSSTSFSRRWTVEVTFEEVIDTQPDTFTTKPFEIKDLQRGVETTLDRMNAEGFGEENIRYYSLKAINREPLEFKIKPFGKPGLPFGQQL